MFGLYLHFIPPKYVFDISQSDTTESNQVEIPYGIPTKVSVDKKEIKIRWEFLPLKGDFCTITEM